MSPLFWVSADKLPTCCVPQLRTPGFQALCAAKTLAASKRQPVYYKTVLQTDQFERKKRFFFFGKCLDFCGSNIICPRSLLGWIVQIKTLEFEHNKKVKDTI